MAEEKIYLGKDQLALVWQLIKNGFVAKADGKGLSTNDFTTDLLTKLNGIHAGATTVAISTKNGVIVIDGKEETVYTLPPASTSALGGVMIGSGLSLDDAGKLVNAITKLSQLQNDAGFITTGDIPEGAAASTTLPKMAGTASVGTELAFARGDHVHPRDTNVYTKAEVDALVSAALTYKGTKTTYSALPTTGNKIGDVWNITESDSTHGIHAGDNVAWNGNAWDVLSGAIDLSGYILATDIRPMTNDEIAAICV